MCRQGELILNPEQELSKILNQQQLKIVRVEELFSAVREILNTADRDWPVSFCDESGDPALERYVRGLAVHHVVNKVMSEWSSDKKTFCVRHAARSTCYSCGEDIHSRSFRGLA